MLLIDGHNLIGQMKDLSLSDPDDEEQLLARLAEYRRGRRLQITVVFDPGPHGGPQQPWPETRAGIRVVYARAGQQADDVICHLVRQTRDRQGCLVVSSDRAVQAEARHLGATIIPAQDFARQLLPPARIPPPSAKEQPPTPHEVEDWLRIFSRRRRSPR